MPLCPNWLHWMRCTNSYIVSPGNLTFPLTILRLLLLPWSTLKTFRRPGEDTPMAFINMCSAERSYFMIYLCFLKWRARGYRAVFGRTSVQGTWWTAAPKTTQHNLWWEGMYSNWSFGSTFPRSSLVFIIICPSWQLKKRTMSFGRAEPFNCEDDRSVGYFISCLSGHIRCWCYYLYALYSVLMWKIKIIIGREIMLTDIGNWN